MFAWIAKSGNISKEWNFAVFLSDKYDSKVMKRCFKCGSAIMFVGSRGIFSAFECAKCSKLFIVIDISVVNISYDDAIN